MDNRFKKAMTMMSETFANSCWAFRLSVVLTLEQEGPVFSIRGQRRSPGEVACGILLILPRAGAGVVTSHAVRTRGELQRTRTTFPKIQHIPLTRLGEAESVCPAEVRSRLQFVPARPF